MNPAQIKCLLVFSVFAIIGFGPISPGCLIGMYVVVKRPRWFLSLARDLYSDVAPERFRDTEGALGKNPSVTRVKCFLCLLGLFVLDIAPYPVTPAVAFVILLARPVWFHEMVETIYSESTVG